MIVVDTSVLSLAFRRPAGGVASLTIEHGARLLATDRDFEHIAEHSELRIERI